jgi:hypothetical protein
MLNIQSFEVKEGAKSHSHAAKMPAGVPRKL